ncbi:MAG: hypothetical protein IJD01_03495 [Clostridia bacterium]|nr:hypothetical protein [Clostridia bacterium]
MKKLLSIVLAIALMASMSMTAFAATDLIANATQIGGNNADYATVTDNGDGSYTVVVTKDANADFSEAYGLAVEQFMSDVDLTKTPYVDIKLESDVPFRITMLDKNAAGETKWISFAGEFFNTVYPVDQEAPSTVPENNFFPAGEYDCRAFLKGYYDWKTNNDKLEGYDPASANITAFYIELQKAGTLTLSKLALTEEEPTGEEDTGSDTQTTTTKKQSSSKDDNPKTGVESDAIALAVVALAAAGVVTLSVVSKKAKSR